MPIALIIMERNPGGKRDAQMPDILDDDAIRMKKLQNSQEEQALALAAALAAHAENAPILMGRKKSGFLAKAQEAGFDCLPLTGGLLDKLRLWAWRRKKNLSKILAFGEDSLPTAWRLSQISKPSPCPIYAVFSSEPSGTCKFMAHARHIICNSTWLAENIREKLDDNAVNIKFILPGINLRDWPKNSPDRREQAKSRFIFGMAESLFPNAGALDVIRAMSAIWLMEDLPDWEVRMFGAGSCFEKLLDEAKKLGVASRLSLLSEQPLAETAPLCDAWIAPGFSQLEAPETLWAGIAANLPLICTDTPLARDWLPQYKDMALTVPVESPQELASAMMEIMKDQSLRLRLLSKSQSWRKNIGLAALAERIIAYMEQTSGDSPRQV